MFGFSKNQLKGVSLILVLIIVITGVNLVASLRRSRDLQRKSDVRLVSDLTVNYQKEFGVLSLSKDGKIYIPTGELNGNVAVYATCSWGYECLAGEKIDRSSPAYLGRLPVDPHNDKKVSYLFFSDGKYYQIYASLEGLMEEERDSKIESRGLQCGVRICNYGIGSAPLDKSLEDYERQLQEEAL